MAKVTFKVNNEATTSQEFIDQFSKNILKKELTVRLRTAFIFALAEAEKRFGDIWGHNNQEKTVEQLEFEKIYKEFRKNVLDNGNNQIRSLDDLLSLFEVTRKDTIYE